MIMSTRCCGFASLALLCTLAVICFQAVCGEEFSGPTVTECRPHIERALKEQLQHTGTTSERFGSAEDESTIENDVSIEIPINQPEETETTSSENTITVEVEGETSIEDTVNGSTEDKSESVEQTVTTSTENDETKSTEDIQTQWDEKSTEKDKPESDEVSEAASTEDEAKSTDEAVKSEEDQGETEETIENKSEEEADTISKEIVKSDEADMKSSETEEKSTIAEEISGERDAKSEEVEAKSEADAKSEEDETKSEETAAQSEQDDGKSEEVDVTSDKSEAQSEEVETKSEEDTSKFTETIVEQSAEIEKSDEEQVASTSVETQSAEDTDTKSSEREEVDEVHIREERSAVSAEKSDELTENQADSKEQGSELSSEETQQSVETADAETTSGETKEEQTESTENLQTKESQSEEKDSPKDEGHKEDDESVEEKSSEKQDAPEGTTAEVAESSETIESIVEPVSDESTLDVTSGEKSSEREDETKTEFAEKDEQILAETKSSEEKKTSAEEIEDVQKSAEEHPADEVQEDVEQVSVEKQESVETEAGEGKESQEDVTEQKSEEKVEIEGKSEETEAVEKAESESEDKSEDETEVVSAESNPEDELTKEFLIPENLRNRDHLDQLLGFSEELTETDLAIAKSIDVTLRELKRLYDTAIKPLEIVYKYRDLSNRHFGDPEIFSKPLVLFMGPWSGGKSSIINYLTNNEYNEFSLRTGAEPSPAYFNILMWGSEPEILDGTQLAADWTFSGLQKFGQGLEDRLRGLKLPNKLLEKVNIVEIPGILEVRKQVSRVFPFNDACQWFIDRADIIFLVYDPSKLDVGPETEAILDQLKGREYQTRILLNKGDTVKPEELMRVQGALIWNISPLMSSAQPPVMYTTSLWSTPFTPGSPERLLMAQERAFLRDLRQAIEKRVENKISSARRFAVRVRNHAKMVDCYLTTYYNHKTLFGNRKQISDAIIEHPQEYHIYEGLSTLTNISRYDLPDPEVYRDFFKLNPLYEFQQLSATCTYFRGCPINRLDVAIAYDLPELVGKYKKMVESAMASNKPNNS